MSLATSLNPFLNFQLAGPAIEGTQPLIDTRPSTPLPGDLADTNWRPHSHQSPLTSMHHLMKRNSSHLLKSSSCGTASSKPVSLRITAVSMHLTTLSSKLSAHFILNSPLAHAHGSLSSLVMSKAYPSDVTKLKSGAALRLEDRTISINMLTEEHPTHYIRLIKSIRRDQGYVIYEFTSDLFSCFSTPQPEKPPTTLSLSLSSMPTTKLLTSSPKGNLPSESLGERLCHRSSSHLGQGSFCYYALEEHDLVE